MRKMLVFTAVWLLIPLSVRAQDTAFVFQTVRSIGSTPVKNQARTGTCWSFATTSFIETELLRMGKAPVDISEMYFVRMNYPQKVRNYVRMHGDAALGEGSLAQDVMRAIRLYGIVPETVYPGRRYGAARHDHSELQPVLKAVGDALVQAGGDLTPVWPDAIEGILDAYLGTPPQQFTFGGKTYTPMSYARELGVKPDDYVELTSFVHHPFDTWFALEIPDNWARNPSFNVPLDELIGAIDHALEQGFSVAWDGDVSERTFCQDNGVAVWPVKAWADRSDAERRTVCRAPEPEAVVTQESRQRGFDNYSSSDDHLMHLTGIARDQRGTKYYITKNSWGEAGPMAGYIHMSEAFVRAKTMTVLIHRDGLSKTIRDRLARR